MVDLPGEVTCTYVMQNDWSEALGVGPFTGSSFEFVIAAGQIQELRHAFYTVQFGSQTWDVFRNWVSDTHPDDLNAMYDFSNPSTQIPRKTPEVIALWEQYTAEFVASLPES